MKTSPTKQLTQNLLLSSSVLCPRIVPTHQLALFFTSSPFSSFASSVFILLTLLDWTGRTLQYVLVVVLLLRLLVLHYWCLAITWQLTKYDLSNPSFVMSYTCINIFLFDLAVLMHKCASCPVASSNKDQCPYFHCNNSITFTKTVQSTGLV